MYCVSNVFGCPGLAAKGRRNRFTAINQLPCHQGRFLWRPFPSFPEGGCSKIVRFTSLALLCLAACSLAHTAAAQTNAISSSATNTVGLWANGTEYLHVGSTGDVGIGTTAPTTNLMIYNSGSSGVAETIGDGGASSVRSTAYQNATQGAFVELRHGRGSLASPSATQSGDFLGRLAFEGYTGSSSLGFENGARIESDAEDNWSSTANGSNLGFYTVADGTTTQSERMLITGAGNVGIGTASPSYTLHVNGTAYATGAAGALSDRRHKKNVAPLGDGALALVGKLKPVSFEWIDPRDDGMKGRQIGFIAQDVEPVIPEAVMTENNGEKTKILKYDSLIPILAKAVQELKVDNDDLRKIIAREENEIADLRHEVRPQ